MKTEFTAEQLKDPKITRANEILRSCVHCGFCTATCPTYQVLGDELDSPRGRIYLIKDMLENNRVPDAKTVKHIDRCLSCLACMTTCPSGVHYMHLVDHAREYIEERYKRPLGDRALRWILARILPYPTRFRLALLGAKIGRPFARLMPDARLRAMLEMAPRQIPPVSRNDDPQSFAPQGARKKRVALMTGCAQKALNTDINDATIRLLTRLGCEVVVAEGAGCCGALTHHMGKSDESHRTAAKNIRAWAREMDGGGLDAIVINTSGCGTTVKDYGHMFRDGPLAEDAARVADELAHMVAELESEYQAAWQAGQEYSQEGETIATARAAARAILSERRELIRANGSGWPAVCDAIRAQVTAHCDTIRTARERRAELAAGDDPTFYFWARSERMQAAFVDGGDLDCFPTF
jgi:glycolate oxidase iron-sulfur subunit